MYRELQNTNARRFSQMVYSAFAILIFLYVITMTAGYSTFGDTTLGNILLNYHPKDKLALLGQVATGCSILFGFPLAAAGARESIVSAIPVLQKDKYHAAVVISLLSITTGTAIVAQDIGLVMGLTGAALGTFICYICPALLYDKAAALRYGGTTSLEYRRTTRLAKVLVPFGIALAGLGVWMTLQSA
jgi:sodium-coupled neutral amino acid transporter 10